MHQRLRFALPIGGFNSWQALSRKVSVTWLIHALLESRPPRCCSAVFLGTTGRGPDASFVKPTHGNSKTNQGSFDASCHQRSPPPLPRPAHADYVGYSNIGSKTWFRGAEESISAFYHQNTVLKPTFSHPQRLPGRFARLKAVDDVFKLIDVEFGAREAAAEGGLYTNVVGDQSQHAAQLRQSLCVGEDGP